MANAPYPPRTTRISPTQAEFALAETLHDKIIRVVSLSFDDPAAAAKYTAVGSFWTHPTLRVNAIDESGKPLGYGELVVVVRIKE